MPKIYAYDGMSFLNLRFENDVKKYGIQAMYITLDMNSKFENDVKKYGIQALLLFIDGSLSLRMM